MQDRERNGALRPLHLVAEQCGVGVAGIIVERDQQRAAETGEKSARQAERLLEMERAPEVGVREPGQRDEQQRQHGGVGEQRSDRRDFRGAAIEQRNGQEADANGDGVVR